MHLGLENRIALVAGSSQGLGRAVAIELAAEGATVVVCARDSQALEQAAEEVRQTGGKALAVVADLAHPEGPASAVAAALQHFGRVDILVNNAGGPPAGPFESLTPEMWRQATRLTLESALEMTRGVLPGMKERRWGRILNITSIAVKQPVDNLILSNSLRAAVTGFARTLANEVAPWGITVNNVLPGYTRTRRLDELATRLSAQQGISEQQVRAKWEREIPMGRLGDPKEFAAVVAFLASERASYVTGVSLTVDGGWVRSLL